MEARTPSLDFTVFAVPFSSMTAAEKLPPVLEDREKETLLPDDK